MFKKAVSFDQDISYWDISFANKMDLFFDKTHALSNANKGKIHTSFSTNSNWPYDWSAHVANPPLNQTGENNQTAPSDDNGTNPAVDQNQTQTDQNTSVPALGVPVVTLYRPFPKTLTPKELDLSLIHI